MESSNAVGRRRGETRGRDETQGWTDRETWNKASLGLMELKVRETRDRITEGPQEQWRAEWVR